jgi:hypothetical protein
MIDLVGVSEFADDTRVGGPSISKYCAPPAPEGDPRARDDQYMPVDIVLDAELRTGPMVTRLMADILGFDLVPKASAADAPLAAVTVDAVLRASKECADVAAAFLERSPDGLDLQDRQVMGREIDEAISELTKLRAMVGGR